MRSVFFQVLIPMRTVSDSQDSTMEVSEMLVAPQWSTRDQKCREMWRRIERRAKSIRDQSMAMKAAVGALVAEGSADEIRVRRGRWISLEVLFWLLARPPFSCCRCADLLCVSSLLSLWPFVSSSIAAQ